MSFVITEPVIQSITITPEPCIFNQQITIVIAVVEVTRELQPELITSGEFYGGEI